MTIFIAAVLAVGAVAYLLFVRPQDLPEAEPQSPVQHLEDKRARIYESLRDLQFEYRVGKLSEEDYQKSKAELQNDLAKLNAAIEQLAGKAGPAPQRAAPSPAKQTARICPRCGAEFDRELKFCGECGQPMRGSAA